MGSRVKVNEEGCLGAKRRVQIWAAAGALLLSAGAAAAQAPAPGAAIPAGSKLRSSMPAMRTLEYTYNRASTDPGRYRAAGYRSWIAGLAPSDLFAPPTYPLASALGSLLGTLGTANETTARFTHTEAGCLYSTIPKTPNLAGVLSPNLVEPMLTTTHARARQCVYYTETPTGRAWTSPKSFTGKLAAVFHLVDETDFIDLSSRVGSGTATVEVACANDVTLAGGRVFNLGSIASSYVADFQFQIVPKPPVLTDPDFKDYTVVFADSGVWKILDRNPVPACGTTADICATPIATCP